jgi:hypothetical protein
MANGNGNGDGNSDGDGDDNCNDDDNGSSNNDIVITITDTREDCLFMRWQCAALWQGQCLASPPWTQRSVHCPALRHGGANAKNVCSNSGGGILTAHHELGFYFLQLLFSLLNNPLFPHTIKALKNTVSPLMFNLLNSYCIFLQR